MAVLKRWKDLSSEETRKILDFKPPKYCRWFYHFYKKYLGVTIVFSILSVAVLGIIYNNSNLEFWNLLLGIFFFIVALGLWALSSYLIQHLSTKKFAKSMGLTLENWNYLTQGMSWWDY